MLSVVVMGGAVLLSVLIALPALALLLLTLAALRAHRGATAWRGIRQGALVVLIPAHNEGPHIGGTVRAVLAQLRVGDRVLVVADNCEDDTAAQARAAGAQVVERRDAHRRGKGFALAAGVDHLRTEPPAVVLVVDADCRLSLGAANRIAAECEACGRPVQMLDLMQAGPGGSRLQRTLEFAMRVKNWVRPLGSSQLGDACHLMGTGMAFPWRVLAEAPLATGHVAEDMELGLALAARGLPARFISAVQVSSRFVADAGNLRTQKSRWEHGHLQVMGQHLGTLMTLAWRQRRLAPLALALDLCIPPLALYVLVLASGLVVLGGLSGASALFAPAFGVTWVAAGALVGALTLAWWHWGRDLLRLPELMSLPLYALWKVPIYLAYAVGQRAQWVRAARQGEREGERP